MPMIDTARIEQSEASGTPGFATDVFGNRKPVSAISAKHRLFMIFAGQPEGPRMVGQGLMTREARIVFVAALEPDRDNVQGRVVMGAAGVGSDVHSMNARSMNHAAIHENRIMSGTARSVPSSTHSVN